MRQGFHRVSSVDEQLVYWRTRQQAANPATGPFDERQDFIRSEWRVTDNNRRARYYSLTARGRRYLNESLAQWRRMSRAINLVLDVTTV
jgi:hypothetical protein